MEFTFAHNNFNVRDLDKSLAFYKEALGLSEVRRKEAADGSFIIVFLRISIILRFILWEILKMPRTLWQMLLWKSGATSEN